MAERVSTLHRTTVDLPPSCLEFVPGHEDFLVVGTYSLESGEAEAKADDGDDNDVDDEQKRAQSKKGGIILYRLDSNKQPQVVHTLEYPAAVFDLHYCPDAPNFFAIVASDGTVAILTVNWTTQHLRICKKFQVFESSICITSGVWASTNDRVFGLTLDTGAVALIQFTRTFSDFTMICEEVHMHSTRYSPTEAWTVAFGRSFPIVHERNDTTLYSGGDDNRLRCFISGGDFGTDRLGPGGSRGIDGHEAGVTAILPLPVETVPGREMLITGSYDLHIRLLNMGNWREDTAGNTSAQEVLAELNLGGGVWRLKYLQPTKLPSVLLPHVRERFLILASCMHAGAKVIELAGYFGGSWTFTVLGEFKEHQSMNYASDVQDGPEDDKLTIVSTSFYDKLMAVWSFDLRSSGDPPRMNRTEEATESDT